MFVSQAHSLKQQARLAITLAWIAGYTNIVTFLRCNTVTSHVSGTASNFGHDLFVGDWRKAGFALFLLTTFFIGASISGFCTELGRRRGWESIYVLPIVVEAFLLLLFAIAIEVFDQPADQIRGLFYWLPGIAAAAMGLQNATITRISSGTVRTTHVTGVLTDLGNESVQFFWWLLDRSRNISPAPARGLLYGIYTHQPSRRLILLASILCTFILGAGLGALAYGHMPRLAMFPPVAFLGWIIYQDLTKPIAEIEPSALFNSNLVVGLPAALAVYHLRKDHDRKGSVHRLPNLIDWADRLPATARAVILDLAEVTQLDGNAVLELRAVVNRFHTQGRELIIAGISSERLTHLKGPDGLLPDENTCSDLELAIARGINLLEQANPTTRVA